MDTLTIVANERLRIFTTDGSAVTEIVNMLYLGPTDDPAHLAEMVSALVALGSNVRPPANGAAKNGSAAKVRHRAPSPSNRAPGRERFNPIPRNENARKSRIRTMAPLRSAWVRPELSHERELARTLVLHGYAEQRPDPEWNKLSAEKRGRQPNQYRLTSKGHELLATLEA